MRLGGHPSDSFSVPTVSLLVLFFSHALVSIDVIVRNLTNGCLWIHERKFYPKMGQKQSIKDAGLAFWDDLLERSEYFHFR